jgi:predicted Zn-dependent peptidase
MTVPNRTLPVLQIRLAILTGGAADGERPGLAALTAELVKESGAPGLSSRDTFARIEALGAELSVEVTPDWTSFGLAVTKDQLTEALELLGSMVLKSPLSQAQFDRLKKQRVEEASALAREDGNWAAELILFRDLFAMPTDIHPYAAHAATAEEVAKISATDCRSFFAKNYVPKASLLVVTGDTTPDDVKRAAEKALGSYRGGEPPVVSFTDPNPQEARKITVIDRPKSAQSQIYAGVLGPRPTEASWAAFEVARGVLGMAFTGRLSRDVREKRGLAYITFATTEMLAGSPSVFYAYAATKTETTGLALEAVLQHLERAASEEPTPAEVETAATNLAVLTAVSLDRPGLLADMTVMLRGLGLPDDHLSAHAKELREVTPGASLKAASDSIRAGHEVIVAAGDALVIGPMLSRFGEVKVLDPTRGFHRVRTLPMNPSAALSVPAPKEAGK